MLQCIFNAIKSSSNFGKQQATNGEREREREREREIYGKEKKIQSNKEQIKKKKINRQLVTVNWKRQLVIVNWKTKRL